MNSERNPKYYKWGLTALSIVAASLLLSFVLNRFGAVQKIFASLVAILMPIICGALMAFLMAPTYNSIHIGMKNWLIRKKLKPQTASGISRFAATLASIVILLAVVVGLFAMVIPQLIDSIRTMFNSIPQGMEGVYAFLERVLAKYPSIRDTVIQQYDNIVNQVDNWMSGELIPNLNKYFTSFSNGVLKVMNAVKNFGIGIIVMAYMLNIKETLAAQSKKIVYSIFSVQRANDVIEESRYVKTVFSQFIVGKLIDSAIIGVICFIVMSICRLPFTLLISVFVGVTNIIPFFGPFIGAIPSAFILLIISPFQCLQFVIIIFILQQFDGNFLGPKILGQTTGLSSFWVLFSILFFGGLWGIVGMLIGVPTFAVIYRLVGRNVNSRLLKKHLSFQTTDYWNLQRIDEESGEYIKSGDGQ